MRRESAMKIEISDDVYRDFSEYLAKVFLSDDVSSHVEGLLLSELRGRAWPGYETDLLTGCFNRFKLIQMINSSTLGKGWDDHSVYEEKFLCLDIDNFKSYIDIHGLRESDRVLVAIAERLRTLYPRGNVYRFGGDEFVVVLGDHEIENLDIPYDVTLKQSRVHVSVSRNQRRNHHVNREILFHLDKGIVESTEDGNEIRYEKKIGA